MKVDLYQLMPNGLQKTVATCHLVGTIVEIEGEPSLKHNLTTVGIRNYSTTGPIQLYPKDGQYFLDQLQYNFKAGYLSATKPISD